MAEQCATTDRLAARTAVWGPGPDGVNPVDLLGDSIVALAPRRVVEIGCGPGALAQQVCRALPSCDYLATDASPAMVAATADRGVRAVVADAASVPVPDDWADVVVAAWMLYHVPDVDAALHECARILAPKGSFFAVTNGRAHLATLRADAGAPPLSTAFESESGANALERHFGRVDRQDIRTEARFPDHAAATAYLATIDPGLAAALPPFTGGRRDAGHTTIFTAREPRLV